MKKFTLNQLKDQNEIVVAEANKSADRMKKIQNVKNSISKILGDLKLKGIPKMNKTDFTSSTNNIALVKNAKVNPKDILSGIFDAVTYSVILERVDVDRETALLSVEYNVKYGSSSYKFSKELSLNKGKWT